LNTTLLQANEDTPQIYSLCGRGPRSTLRVLRHGLAVTVMAVSELPGNPSAVWTVKVKLACHVRFAKAAEKSRERPGSQAHARPTLCPLQ
jgi:hypothetical protein